MTSLSWADWSARFDRSARPVRIVLPLALGGFAALGHDVAAGGAFVCAAFVLALLVLPVAVRRAWWFGWLMGVGYFGWTLRWIVEPFMVDVARHGWMAPFAIMAMAGGLALFWGASFWAARWLGGRSAGVFVILPLTFGAMELLRGHILSGFPWGLPSYTVIGSIWDVWFAWVGPFGTNILLIGVAAAIAYGLRRGLTLIWGLPIAVAVGTVLMSVGAEPTRLSDQTVRLIQPNAPQHLKWNRDWVSVFYTRALDQTRAGTVPDLVIWPETSIPSILDFAGPLIDDIALAARGAPVVAGIQRRAGEAYFNSAIMIEAPETITDIADKTHLVPFGEYIPLARFLEPLGLGTLVDQVAGFSPGTGDGVMQIPGLGLARVLICYEGIFPEEIQRGAARPDILMILTNDAWFGKNAGPRQHLVQAQARAIEQGLPVVRAANTGISAVIDGHGRIIASLPLNEAGYLDAVVPLALPMTPYARAGDWPLTLVLGLAILAAGVRRRRFVVDPA